MIYLIERFLLKLNEKLILNRNIIINIKLYKNEGFQDFKRGFFKIVKLVLDKFYKTIDITTELISGCTLKYGPSPTFFGPIKKIKVQSMHRPGPAE